MRLGESVGRLAQAGSVKTSAEILKSMNAIANVGQATKDVVAMSKEMFKLGVIEDVLEEEETERAVDVILKEFAGEVAGAMPEKVVEHEQPKTTEAVVVPSVSKEDDERRPVVVDVQSRLDALRE